MKKKIIPSIAIILVLATLVAVFPISAFASNDNSEYFPKYTGKSCSIVDALKSLGIDSSFSYRKNIAKKNGIANYSGSASDNNQLLSLLKGGKLKNPSYNIPSATVQNTQTTNSKETNNNSNSSKYYPQYKGKSGSIVTALSSLGINSSYNYREKIAKANSIGNPYQGSAAQNIQMLSLLKKGMLIRAEYVVVNNTSNSHTHNMKKVSDTGNVCIQYCACGFFDCKKVGVVGVATGAVSIPLPNGGNLVDLGALKDAVDSLVAAGGAAVASASPYILGALVAGVSVIIILNYVGNTLEITKVEKATRVEKLDELEENKFYRAGLVKNGDFKSVIIIKEKEMDMKEAIKYVKMIAEFNLPHKVEVGNVEITLDSVYTLNPKAAENICKQLVGSNTKYTYGNSKGGNCLAECNTKYQADYIFYYAHYHIHYWNPRNQDHIKVKNLHIFFGTPIFLKKPSTT